MNILIINCGSSSFKYQLIDMNGEKVLCSGLVERIGEGGNGDLTHKKAPGTDAEKKFSFNQPFPDHTTGLKTVMDILVSGETAVINSLEEIKAVGHRVVQGGDILQKSCLITEEVKKDIAELIPLAPLHNPGHLQGIEVVQKLLPHAPSVAVFDTEFHSTMPAKSYMYPIPYELYEKNRIRRYGFHGTSHGYVAKAAADFLGKDFATFNAVTCHLGNGCSIAAVENGKCVDTSMGLTPLAGVMMGTRCGDIDPAICAFIAEHKAMSASQVDNMLNKQSGLKGICGMNDMRDIHSACEKGDEKAQLALDMFSHTIRRFIGSYIAILGRIDALIFTAGIGENDDIARRMICENFGIFGIEICNTKNSTRSPEPRSISKDGTATPVLVIPTNEELAIAQATLKIVKA